MIGIDAALNSFSASVIDRIMKAIWAAAMWLLRTAFGLMDSIGGFHDGSTLVDASGRPSPAAPFFALWPTLLWIGGAVAVGLFLWQLTLTMIRGGSGFWRVVSGPAAYSVATGMTIGAVAALVGAAEGVTVLVLERGLAAENFRTILDHPSLGFSDSPALDSSLDATARALLLGMIALFGVLPAAVGFLLQMIFRQAVIIVLIATVPITAAGLLANTTATWFWRSLRWMLAAILMKPALALVLVIGVNMLSGPTGVGGLLAGAGVLLISLFCPLVLFRLLAFVETAGRTAAAGRVGAAAAAGPIGAFAESHLEHVNTARFDAATSGAAGARPARSGAMPAGGLPSGLAAELQARVGVALDESGSGPDPGSPRNGSAGSRRRGAGGRRTAGEHPPTTDVPVGRPPGAARATVVPRDSGAGGVTASDIGIGSPRSADPADPVDRRGRAGPTGRRGGQPR